MPHAIVVHQPGGPEVLSWEEVPTRELQPGQARISNTAVGFNMVDTYFRKGLYPAAMPMILGIEAAGVVEEINPGDQHLSLKIGDRVVYQTQAGGTYAEQSVIDSASLIVLPDNINDTDAAASFVKGLTAWAFIHKSYRVKPGDTILVYAAAGGVGLLMCQWASHLGAQVIGIVGSEKKVQSAKSAGCDAVINRHSQNIVEAVSKLTSGQGVQAVYDSLGCETFEDSLKCLAPLGTMVSFGNATGPVPPVDILQLAQMGSLSLIRPRVFDYVAQRADLEEGANKLFEAISQGILTIEINQQFPLAKAADAHRAVESQHTTGSTILIP